MSTNYQKILLIGYGYIGQFLFNSLDKRGYDCTVLSETIERRSDKKIERRYQDLTSVFLAEFTHIFWFAGHSSVSKSKSDPIGAMRNNVISLLNWPANCRLMLSWFTQVLLVFILVLKMEK